MPTPFHLPEIGESGVLLIPRELLPDDDERDGLDIFVESILEEARRPLEEGEGHGSVVPMVVVT